MATYVEIRDIATTGSVLIQKMQVAAAIAANKIRLEADSTPNHANRLKWAKYAFQNSEQAARDLLWPVLAANASFTSVAILAASDALVQSAVDSAIDTLAQG